ncbi:uncharacterized protein LY89DRAFT_123378 [Mollisia scopiformis]|uniref:Uncharacterized protein n=1 Tax=Mollisia scopiformis TaxID=149040 RepID=A0A194X3R6_MOLSC|nr:uncharacterized protein LY89DRAFT_123378 [Mollisia scopiformis]KUJ14835.1 hypothetical protein LY89DRAFT_123378 [Mollisia scopiformis]
MFSNPIIIGLLCLTGVNAQTATETAESGQLLPTQSSLLVSALSAYETSALAASQFSAIASELATATAGPADLLVLAADAIAQDNAGGTSFSAEVASVLSEYPPDVSSWFVSLTMGEQNIVTSVLGTTLVPTGAADDLGGTSSGTGPVVVATATGSGTTVTGTGTAGASKTTSSASKNAGPTLGAMSGAACGVVAFGAAAACAIGMM